MNSNVIATKREWGAAAALALGCAIAATVLLNAGWPHVGFDFSYFLPRLFDVRLHQLQDGWFSIQWWTPSFGAGIPGFANPQHTQFMLAQFLVPLLGIWGAAVGQAALCVAAGVLLLFAACRIRLGYSVGGSFLAAAAWGTNAFFWEHTMMGHLGFNTFPLIAILPHALSQSVTPIRGCLLLAATAATIVFTGGYTIILVFALSGLLLAWTLPLIRPTAYTITSCLGRLVVGGLVGGLIAASKIVAAGMFLAQFPRLAAYAFAGPVWAGPGALFAQLFVLDGAASASRWLPLSPEAWKATLGEDVGFAPIIVVVLLVGAVVALRHRRKKKGIRPVIWIGLGFSIWLIAEISLGRGLIWPHLKPLPFLRSLHENHRFTAAFALPIVLLVAPAWDRIAGTWSRSVTRVALTVAILGCFASLEPHWRNRNGFWSAGFDATTLQQTTRALTQNPSERFPIVRVADVRDDATFLAGASSWKPYEPIFGYGYGGSSFRVRLAPGLIEPLPTGKGAWRFHFPAAFTAPKATKVDPFAPIPAAEQPALMRLLHRHQPDWPLSPLQQFANGLTLAAIVLAVAFFSFAPKLQRIRLFGARPPILPSTR